MVSNIFKIFKTIGDATNNTEETNQRMLPNKRVKLVLALIIVLASLLINTGMFIRYQQKDAGLTFDQMQYDQIALSIIQGKSCYDYPEQYGGNTHDIGEIGMPGYSVFLVIIYLVFGHHFLAVYIIQALISTVAALLFFHVMSRHVKTWAALASTLWLILYYPLWNGSFLLMRESLSASLYIFCLFIIDKYWSEEKEKYLYLFSLFFGILVAVYNHLLMHFGFFCFFMFFLFLKKKVAFKKIMISGLIVAAVLLPWHIRQYSVHHRIVIFGPAYTDMTQGTYVVRTFLPYEEARKEVVEGGFNDEGREYFKQHFTKEKYEEMKANYKAFHGFGKYLSRFKGFWEIYTRDIRFGFGGDTRLAVPSSKIRKYCEIILFAPMILFFLIGFVFSIIRSNRFFQLLGVFIGSHVLLHTLIHYIPRYRVIVIPMIFMLGWFGVDQLVKLFHKPTEKNIE